MSDRDELDRLLDVALSSYAAPPAEFEVRLLRTLAPEEETAGLGRGARWFRRGWLVWGVVLAGAACLLLTVLPRLPRPRPHVSIAGGTHPAPLPAPSIERQSVATATVPERRHPKTVRTMPRAESGSPKVPKQDVFPSPQPLSGMEQELVSYIAAAPDESRQKLIEAQQRRDEPVRISAIQIPPINPPAGSQGEP